jgi:hypothetical protein
VANPYGQLPCTDARQYILDAAMSSSGTSTRLKGHLLPQQTTSFVPSISLTVRDLNVVRPPQRTSSLKSSPTVRSNRKKPSQPSKINSSKQPKNAGQQQTPLSGSFLKVAKTRLNTESALPTKYKGNVFGKLDNASAHGFVSEDLSWGRDSDHDTSNSYDINNNELSPSANSNSSLHIDSGCSSTSRPSTALSHSATTSVSRQPHYRRESVRRAVTKAFSTLNRKKRNGRSALPKTDHEVKFSWPVSTSNSSAHCCEDNFVRIESHDSAVCIVGDTKYPPSIDGAHDVESTRTALPSSSGAKGHVSTKRTPPETSFAAYLRSEGFRESSESLLSQPGPPETPSPQARNRQLDVRKRDEPATLRVRLAAKAELKEASFTSENAIWAIVQLHGEVSQATSRSSSPNAERSIAIAIVLDNSCLSTMKDIEKAILEIIGLAEQLQEQVDRLGVFCTAFSYPMDGGADCCILSLSQPLDREHLSNRLKTISKQSQHGYYLESALNQAAEALHELGEAPAPDIKRDIVVMSPNPVGLARYVEMLDASFSVHLFNPGLVPYGILDPVPCSNSQLGAPTEGTIQQYGCFALEQDVSSVEDVACAGWVIDATACISQGCSIHGSHSLYDIVVHSRAQAHTGSITNVSISITPGANISFIEEIIGKLEYSKLQPGQVISIPIRVRLKSLACRLSCIPLPQSPRRSVTEAITDLELTLGEHLSELFRVQVRYSHSTFPENTTLVAQESCWLRRTLKRRVARGDDSLRESVFECVVQKQLALSLARLEPPIDALNALEMEFDSKPVPTYCSKFIEAVKQRLRHRILQSPARRAPEPLPEIESYETELQEFVDERQRQELDMDDSPATVIRRITVHTPDKELHDTARRIWQHIRKTSKPEREISDETVTDHDKLQEPDARMEHIRRMALKNRRKMSTETLKSLARDYTRFSNELGGVDELDVD